MYSKLYGMVQPVQAPRPTAIDDVIDLTDFSESEKKCITGIITSWQQWLWLICSCLLYQSGTWPESQCFCVWPVSNGKTFNVLFRSTENGSISRNPWEEQINVFCYCRCPDDGTTPMVQCDGKHCGEWFHISCINSKINKESKWFYDKCSWTIRMVASYLFTIM